MTTPPAVRRNRPARLQFASSTLVLEALLVLFATLVAAGLAAAEPGGRSPGAVWAAGGTLIVLLVALSRTLGRRGGYAAGSAAQVLVLATGLVVPTMYVVGGIFVVIWIVSLRLGGRIDRERAAWDAAHPDTLGG